MSEEYWEEDFSRQAVAQRLSDARARYRTELRQFWTKEFPLMAAATLLVMPALTWLAYWCAGTHDANWWAMGLCAAAAALVPPVMFMHPLAPTEENVAYGMLLNQIGEAARQRGAVESPTPEAAGE